MLLPSFRTTVLVTVSLKMPPPIAAGGVDTPLGPPQPDAVHVTRALDPVPAFGPQHSLARAAEGHDQDVNHGWH
jgi:hypothetical protein